MILAIEFYLVTLMLTNKFQINWPFGSGEEMKTDFQDSSHGSHLGFQIRTIISIFDLQVNLMFPTKFLLIQEKKRKIDFQDSGHGGHLGFLI